MKKLFLGAILFLVIPFTAFAGFDKTDYYLGDSIFYDGLVNGNVADGQEIYIYVWDSSYNYVHEGFVYDEATGNTQLVPSLEIDADYYIYNPVPNFSVDEVTDLPKDTYHFISWAWYPLDSFDECNTGVDSYATCLTSTSTLENGSFTISHSAEPPPPPEAPDGLYFFSPTSEAKASTSENLASAVTTNMDSGVWQTTLLAISVFLAFYIIQKLMSLFGFAYYKDRRKRRSKD